MKNLDALLDSELRIVRWPKDRRQRELILEYLTAKFEAARSYHELKVNEILKQWHTFSDWSGLRREPVDKGYFSRNYDGTQYIKDTRQK